MELTLKAGCWIKFCKWLAKVKCPYNYYNLLSPKYVLYVYICVTNYYLKSANELYEAKFVLPKYPYFITLVMCDVCCE
jgi:hypothetical protein